MTTVITFDYKFISNVATRLIDWFEAGDVGHVDIRLLDGRQLGARLDRIRLPNGSRCDRGVQIRPYDYGPFRRRIVVEVPIRDWRRGDALRWPYTWLYEQVGKPYDWLAICGFAFERDWRHEGAWFCSELSARWKEVLGLLPAFYGPVTKVTPAMDLAITTSLPGARWALWERDRLGGEWLLARRYPVDEAAWKARFDRIISGR